MKNLSIRMDDELRQKLEEHAKVTGLRPTQVARMFLTQAVTAADSRGIRFSKAADEVAPVSTTTEGEK